MNKKKQIFIWIAMVFAFLVMIFGIVRIVYTAFQYKKSDREYAKLQSEVVSNKEIPEKTIKLVEPGIEIDLASLKKENPDTVGWIYYPALNINYPIMQDDDNDYYIRRTFEGEKNAAGSIFLDCKNDNDFQNMHSILYGHNMRNGSMFGALKEIRKEDTVKKNPYFWIFLEDSVNTYQIFSYHDAETKDDSFLTYFDNEEDYQEFLEHIGELSEEDFDSSLETQDRIVTLSTCTSNPNVRFLVHGKMVK